MSRPIKFRAWDNDRQEYLSAGRILISVEPSRRPRKNHVYVDVLMNPDKYNNRFILEQFTGLYDADGKEIYEGDRVEDERTGAVGVVVFDEGGFDCGNTFEYKGFVELCLRGRIKVIGNIHEGNK